MRVVSSCESLAIGASWWSARGLVGCESSRTSSRLEGRQRVLEEGAPVDCCMCNPVVTTSVSSNMVAKTEAWRTSCSAGTR
jgi:hypothetical protein